jgi:hypothetical protein
MTLLAMNWKNGEPPPDFVGFAIEYREPGGYKFYSLKNRLSFYGVGVGPGANPLSTLLSPIQKFRWVHFPRNADMPGEFTYRVTPVFMNASDELSYGEAQTAPIELARETYAGRLNVAFTRGFISSQAFVERYESAGALSTLLPPNTEEGLDFVPTHPRTDDALHWMGFEARSALMETLDEAANDQQAQVLVAAYELCEPDVLAHLERLGPRLRIIIDDSGKHKQAGSCESRAAARLAASAGADHVKRQHMLGLQHNKTIVVDGPACRKVVCGSTNFSWRGLFVQSNHAVILEGDEPVRVFKQAFENYWSLTPQGFKTASPAQWNDLRLAGIDAQATFSPHSPANALLQSVAADIDAAASSLFFSLAFLYQTPGPVLDAIKRLSSRDDLFIYGVSDRKVNGLEVLKPDGTVGVVYPAALSKNVPPPFKKEPTGGGGVRLHHKFAVIDFNTPDARVYLGSYNFSSQADIKNGENLLLIRDRRVATAFMIEALRIVDHYHFRVKETETRRSGDRLALAKPPRLPGEVAWWEKDFTIPRKILDRELFGKGIWNSKFKK